MRSPIFCDSWTRIENFRLCDVALIQKFKKFPIFTPPVPFWPYLPYSDHMHEALSQLPAMLRTCFARGTRGRVYLAGY